MSDDELLAFRERWKNELANTSSTKEDHRVVSARSPPGDGGGQPGPIEQKNRYFKDLCQSRNSTEQRDTDSPSTPEGSSSIKEDKDAGGRGQGKPEDEPQYVSIARNLLDGRTGCLLDRMQEERTRRKRQYHSITHVCSASVNQQPQRKTTKGDKLVDQLIQDLNEVNDIPFFDIELPYELALKIFQHLDSAELGRCAQVSRVWKVLAEDSVLWFNLCLKEGYHHDASVSDSPCWKSTLRDCRLSDKTVCSNWKNRVGFISQLQFELGKVLCDVSSCERFVLAGYTSGDVRLWDTLHWDSAASFLKPRPLAPDLDPRPHVGRVQVNGTLAAAAYEDGCVDVWSTETGGEPVHFYQSPGTIQALALSPDSPALASAAGQDVRLDQPDDRGYWRTVCQARLPKPVDSVVLVPGRARLCPLAVVAAGESVFLLSPREDEPRSLHSVYGYPVTCLDASGSQAALGLKRGGWSVHDGDNKIQVYSLETGQAEVCVGNSTGDFTCINLRDAPPHLLVCGNKDRRVRVFDLRAGSSVMSLYAHHLGVTAVQADDWKIVSGGGEGLVCVWEARKGGKLWEMHNRHPVRHVRFDSSTLVTANVPDEKSPRGACITDDDLTAHRRHRGVVSHYDFSENATSLDHVLPICRSNYAESSGYNYNIGLAVPYDKLSGSHPAH